MASRLRNRLSQVFSRLQSNDDEIKSTSVDAKGPPIKTEDNARYPPTTTVVPVGVRGLPRDSLENARRTSVLQPDSCLRREHKPDTHLGTVSSFASSTMKILSQTLRANTQFFYGDGVVSPCKEDMETNVCSGMAGNDSKSSVFGSLKRHSRSLRSRCSKSSIGSRQNDRKSAIDLPSVQSFKHLEGLPPGIDIEIPNATLLSPNEQRWIREAHLAGRSRVSLLGRGVPWPTPSEVATRQSANDNSTNSLSDILHNERSGISTVQKELPSQSDEVETPNASDESLSKGKYTRPLSRSFARNPFSLQGLNESYYPHQKISPYRLAVRTSDSNLQTIGKGHESMHFRHSYTKGDDAPGIGLPDLFEKSSSRASSVEVEVNKKVQRGYEADDESDANETISQGDAENCSPPSMGPKAPWEKSRADRNRCYENIKYMSAETLSDTETDTDLQLRRLSSGSSCYSRETGSNYEYETTPKAYKDSLADLYRLPAENVEDDQEVRSCSSVSQSLRSRNVLRASSRPLGACNGLKGESDLRQEYQREDHHRLGPKPDLETIVSADQEDGESLGSSKFLENASEYGHQDPAWGSQLLPPLDNSLCSYSGSDTNILGLSAWANKSSSYACGSINEPVEEASFCVPGEFPLVEEVKSVEAPVPTESYGSIEAVISSYSQGPLNFAEPEDDGYPACSTWPIEPPKHWGSLGSLCVQDYETPFYPSSASSRNGRISLFDELSNLPRLITSERPTMGSRSSMTSYDNFFSQDPLSATTSDYFSPSRDDSRISPATLHSVSTFDSVPRSKERVSEPQHSPSGPAAEYFHDVFEMKSDVEYVTARAASSSSLASELGVVEIPEPRTCSFGSEDSSRAVAKVGLLTHGNTKHHDSADTLVD